jgi:hypothetical protein
MKKDILLLSVVVIGALGYLTAYSMGPPFPEYIKKKVSATPCPEAGGEQAPGYGGEQAPGYGGEQAPGYGGEQAPGYGEGAAAGTPCPKAGEAGGYSNETGTELGYL